jgi:hypothetical protein
MAAPQEPASLDTLACAALALLDADDYARVRQGIRDRLPASQRLDTHIAGALAYCQAHPLLTMAHATDRYAVLVESARPSPQPVPAQADAPFTTLWSWLPAWMKALLPGAVLVLAGQALLCLALLCLLRRTGARSPKARR